MQAHLGAGGSMGTYLPDSVVGRDVKRRSSFLFKGMDDEKCNKKTESEAS